MSYAHGGWSKLELSTAAAMTTPLEVTLLVDATYTNNTNESTYADGSVVPGLATISFEATTNDIDDTNAWLAAIRAETVLYVKLTGMDGTGTVHLGTNGTTGNGAILYAEELTGAFGEKHGYKITGTFVNVTRDNMIKVAL